MTKPPFALLAALCLSACPPSPGKPDSGIPPEGCPSGQQPSADASHCEPIVPEGDCPHGTMPLLGQSTCESVGWTMCPAGFEADPSGWGCKEVLPDHPCDAGTMAVLGERSCQPVGWVNCPAGFQSDPSGWGCKEVLPPGPCTGATRAALGQASCQPVGSCTDSFPPVGTTHFVDAAYDAGMLDSTHFNTVSAAVAAAPPQAVIAIAPGTYHESVVLPRPVTLVGRCAAQVTLQVPAGAVSGLEASGVPDVLVRGVTVVGGQPGVAALDGAKVSIEDSVIEASRELGAFASGVGVVLTLTRSVVRNTQPSSAGHYGYGADAEGQATVNLVDSELAANHTAGAILQNPNSALHLSRTVIHDTVPAGDGAGHGIQQDGASTTLTVDQSVIANNQVLGVFSTGTNAQATLTDSVVRDTQYGPIGQLAGVQVEAGSHLVMRRCALVANKDMGLFARDFGSTVEVFDSVIRDSLPREGAAAGRGASLQEGASLTLDHCAVVGNREYGVSAGTQGTQLKMVHTLVQGTRRSIGGDFGWGVLAIDGAQATIETCDIEDNTEYGLSFANQGTAGVMKDTVVRGTERSSNPDLPMDNYRVQGIGVEVGAALNIDRSVILGSRQIGLYLWAADEQGTASRAIATNLVVRGTLPYDQTASSLGSGVVVGASSTLVLASSALVGNASVDLLVTEGHSAAFVSDSVFSEARSNPAGDFGYGATAQLGGELQLDRCALVRNSSLGLFSNEAGSAVRANHVLVADTLPDAFGSARSASAQFGANLDLTSSTLLGSTEAGLYLLGLVKTHLTDSWVTGTQGRSDGKFGHGVIADNESELVIERSQVDGSSGIGVAVSGGAVVISKSFISRNAVGIQAQNGSAIVNSSGAPGEPVPLQVQVSEDTQFIGNGARVGSGTVPLPPPAKSPMP